MKKFLRPVWRSESETERASLGLGAPQGQPIDDNFIGARAAEQVPSFHLFCPNELNVAGTEVAEVLARGLKNGQPDGFIEPAERHTGRAASKFAGDFFGFVVHWFIWIPQRLSRMGE